MKASLIKGYSLKFLRVRQSKVPTSLKIIFRDRMHLELLPIQTKMKTEYQKPETKQQKPKQKGTLLFWIVNAQKKIIPK